MQISIQAFGALAVISGLFVSVFLHYQKESFACWTTFATIVFIGFTFCLYWQNSINQKHNKTSPLKEKVRLNDKTIKFPDQKFTETPEEVTVSFGNATMSIKTEKLINT